MKQVTGNIKIAKADETETFKAHPAFEVTFTADQCENEQEAVNTLTKKEWKLVELVNVALKNAARSAKYQLTLAPYKIDTMTEDKLRERLVSDYTRLGVPQDVAEKLVESGLKAGRKAA